MASASALQILNTAQMAGLNNICWLLDRPIHEMKRFWIKGALGDPSNDAVHLITWGSVIGMSVCLLLMGADYFKDIHSVKGFVKFVGFVIVAALILVPAVSAFHWVYYEHE